MLFFYLMCFFFSSRRRHTRCLSDWSSDVCSSDLYGVRDFGDAPRVTWNHHLPVMPYERFDAWHACHKLALATYRLTSGFRSEERRVGKECRSCGATYPQREKEEQHERA